ncbi:alpha/beta hydrolase [Micromonospora sp. NPDC049559]|uniref:alpha/beta hydrolase n=1 Tax=Micromonospora sp. NPDC049559 TaxID=3155923 RepID=UPI003431C131
MITYERLRAMDPAAWRAAGVAWGALVETVDRPAGAIRSGANGLRVVWSGAAAGAADGRLAALRAELAGSRPVLIEIDQLLAEYAEQLARARAMLAAAGPSTGAPRPGGEMPGGGIPGGETTGGAETALALARRADRRAARALTELAADARTGWTAPPPAGRPPATAGPLAVWHWWQRLAPAQRRWLLGREPALVGRLDGVPVAARDQANRLLLADQRAELRARRARLLAQRPATAAGAAELARLDGLLDGLADVEHRLAARNGPRAYLLSLDPAGDGRAVVALGNPDRADNVLTYVPGMTSDLPGLRGELDRAERLAARCGELAPTRQSAAVLWLDYDAPDFVDEAAGAKRAEVAAPGLHRFQEGLRLTHETAEGSTATRTVVGHSYGSLVVGSAARDHGLAADNLVLVGSPGVGVDHAARLSAPGTAVWASTAANDVIQYAARSPGEALAGLAAGVALPGLGLPLVLGRPGEQLWFGRNPVDPGFGARVFAGAPRGHTGYWDAGNPALDSMARIALGVAP